MMKRSARTMAAAGSAPSSAPVCTDGAAGVVVLSDAPRVLTAIVVVMHPSAKGYLAVAVLRGGEIPATKRWSFTVYGKHETAYK